MMLQQPPHALSHHQQTPMAGTWSIGTNCRASNMCTLHVCGSPAASCLLSCCSAACCLAALVPAAMVPAAMLPCCPAACCIAACCPAALQLVDNYCLCCCRPTQHRGWRRERPIGLHLVAGSASCADATGCGNGHRDAVTAGISKPACGGATCSGGASSAFTAGQSWQQAPRHHARPPRT